MPTAEHFDMMIDGLLERKDLFDLLLDEFKKKIEGERDTCRAIFLHLISCRVKNLIAIPHIFVNSESSSGKSYICKKIIEILPPGWVEYRTKITPEAFTYWHNSTTDPGWTWDGKICYLEDIRDDIINSPTFKVMASEGSKALVVIKQKPVEIEIKGHPVMILTAANVFPSAEILNRFSIINLDETSQQTKRIKEKQALEAVMGNHEKYEQVFIEALKLISVVEVRLPEWVKQTVEYFPDDVIRVRRDYPRFLDLMKASAALHQRQREKDMLTSVVWANEQDYENARLAIQKLESAGGVFGLTHRMKKCYDACIKYFKETENGITAQEIYSREPVITERRWHDMLERLAGAGLMRVSVEKNVESGRSRSVFYPTSFLKITLPSVEVLKYSYGHK